MKIRTDFVSNSSSCSFIIKEVGCEKFISISKIFNDIQIPYEFDNTIEISVYTKLKDMLSFAEKLHELEIGCNDPYYYKMDLSEYSEEELNSINWHSSFKLTFGQIIDLPDDLKSYIEAIYFSCDNYGSGPVYLTMLYDFCDINGVEPDATESEHAFKLNETNKFFELLGKKIETNEEKYKHEYIK